MTGGGISNYSFSAPFGGLSPGIYTNVSFPTPLTVVTSASTSTQFSPNVPSNSQKISEPESSESDAEPMHILEPEMPADVQIEQERQEKMARLQDILRNLQPFTLNYFGNLWIPGVYFPVIPPPKLEDFSDMPKLTRMDC